MSAGTYCKFCNHIWKSLNEYNRHISCCEYFYNQRRTPPANEMSKTPTLNKILERLEKAEKRIEHLQQKVQRLQNASNSRNKKVIVEWLNQPSQIPAITFEDWLRQIKAQESDVTKVVNGNLTDGMVSSIYSQILSSNNDAIPIRCFTQKPKTIYVYSIKSQKSNPESCAEEPTWQPMQDSHLERLCNHVQKQILRAYLLWLQPQINLAIQGQVECDEAVMNKRSCMNDRINGHGMHREKRMCEVKKLLFPLIEENLRNIMDIEFE